ncbi:CPCC family cysteine-rich protein [Streptomyces sp. NBC_01604]|uniref:CPCC family cysteine-rich protein n=1 Tax=Streptomyces sp. NBC_01604 TaxID=2975894 RepID=UPI0038653E91
MGSSYRFIRDQAGCRDGRGFLTLGEPSNFEICPVCSWEDDGQDDHDADRVRGGPNGRLSLTEARENFHVMGACDERCTQFVRAPPCRTNTPPSDITS